MKFLHGNLSRKGLVSIANSLKNVRSLISLKVYLHQCNVNSADLNSIKELEDKCKNIKNLEVDARKWEVHIIVIS